MNVMSSTKSICVFFAGLIGLSVALAQKEANIWYFGEEAGIDFSTSPPTALTDGKMDAEEGCASICDTAGNLLFYTNGDTILNRQHENMSDLGNLGGGSSSCQSAVIVRQPGSTTIYYVFTTGQLAGGPSNGLQYSTVDMSLDGGLGKVTQTRTGLEGGIVEQMTAVQTADGQGVWVIVNKRNTSTYHAYLVTASGVETTPVVSPDIGEINDSPYGCIKASPDGRYVAMVISSKNITLFSFNSETGELSDPKVIREANSGTYFYGLEFSPFSNYLYLAESINVFAGPAPGTKSSVFQYDITASDISSTATAILESNDNNQFGSLQLGPDKKIYITQHNRTTIDVIHFPDSAGVKAEYEVAAVDLEGKRITLGLPQFVTTLLKDPADTLLEPVTPPEPEPEPIVVEYDVEVPNVFSPNGDGSNDLFIYNTGNLKEMEMIIYNRWGTKVFETTELNEFWDGNTSGGSLVPPGTYFYTLNAIYLDDKAIEEKGTVTLVE